MYYGNTPEAPRYNQRRAEKNAERQNKIHVEAVEANMEALKTGGREAVQKEMWFRRMWKLIIDFFPKF